MQQPCQMMGYVFSISAPRGRALPVSGDVSTPGQITRPAGPLRREGAPCCIFSLGAVYLHLRPSLQWSVGRAGMATQRGACRAVSGGGNGRPAATPGIATRDAEEGGS